MSQPPSSVDDFPDSGTRSYSSESTKSALRDEERKSSTNKYIRKSAPKTRMSPEEWTSAIQMSLKCLRESRRTIVGREVFTMEQATNRYEVKAEALPYFKIFPWFHKGKRFRQKFQEGTEAPIQEVVDALNYFLSKNGIDYTQSEREALECCYQSLNYLSPISCLTTIIVVCKAFQAKILVNEPKQEEKDQNEEKEAEAETNTKGNHLSPLHLFTENRDLIEKICNHNEQLETLFSRIDVLEILALAKIFEIHDPESTSQFQQTQQQPREKKPRMGGDRACWYEIREADYPSRHEWCVPGGVFGVYSDGVGPLLPAHLRLRRLVVAYSTDPDTIEAHPDPRNFDRYVAVVMVGEAPVNLRPDQYAELRRRKVGCDLYVSPLGDVCVHFDNDPPIKGTKFATTNWLTPYPEDKEGYPIFQGVRGVCAKIIASSNSVDASFRRGNSFWKQTSRSFRTLINGELDLPVRQVMTRRQGIYRQIADIDQRLTIRDRLQTYIQLNSEAIKISTSACQQLDQNVEGDQDTLELYQKLVENLIRTNGILREKQDEFEFKRSRTSLETERRELQRERDRLTRQLKRATKNSRI